MRWLLAIVALLVLGWSGWWWFGATVRERAVESWLAERRADGWVAEAADIRVAGFPNRIDMTVEGLALADPESGWSWTAPEFQVLSLSYKPHQFITVWPGEQVIASPFETTTVASEVMRGSVVFEPNRRLALDRSTIEIEAMTLTGASGWQAGVDTALVSTRQAGDRAPPFSHDVSVEVAGLTPPRGWLDGIDRAGVLPDAIDALTLDATLVFDRPWDRVAVEGDNPALQQVRLRGATARWGELELSGSGTVSADAAGFAEGEIELEARNWREVLAVAEAGGLLPPAVAGGIRTGLELLARFGGGGDSLSVPLEFRDGRTRLGPVPVGPAPRLTRG